MYPKLGAILVAADSNAAFYGTCVTLTCLNNAVSASEHKQCPEAEKQTQQSILSS